MTGNQSIEVTTSLEHFEREGATVTLELTELNSFYSYHVSALPQLMSHMFIESTMVQIKVFYNVHYNVSIIATSACGKSITTFTDIYYGELISSLIPRLPNLFSVFLSCF